MTHATRPNSTPTHARGRGVTTKRSRLGRLRAGLGGLLSARLSARPCARMCCCLLAMTVVGCDDKAIEFARQTKALLTQRSDQLARKIAAETEAYNQAATVAAETYRDLIDSSLRNERNERAASLAADYQEGRKPISLWHAHLSEYARIDYEANRELLTADTDASSRYLRQFEALKVEQDKVDALAKLLDALIARPTVQQNITSLETFARDTQTEFEKRVCAEIQKKGTPPPQSAAGKVSAAVDCSKK